MLLRVEASDGLPKSQGGRVVKLRRFFPGTRSRTSLETARGACATLEPGGLSHNKVCCLEDFENPELIRWLRSVFAYECQRFGPQFPRDREYRKYWEMAMSARAMHGAGVLHDRAQVLGVGAGNEPTIFWLTNHVGRVFATDLYADAGPWSVFAHPSMLTAPGRHSPYPWNPRRLVVQHMNALELGYEDETFDAIFSSSSIEHFGTYDDVRRSAEEMFRVLKPGGLLTLSTEFRVEGPPPGVPGVLLFDAEDLARYIIGGLAWSPISPLEFDVSAISRQPEHPLVGYVAEWDRHFVQNGGMAAWNRLEFEAYPQLMLRHGEHLFTSYHLALRKSPRGG